MYIYPYAIFSFSAHRNERLPLLHVEREDEFVEVIMTRLNHLFV